MTSTSGVVIIPGPVEGVPREADYGFCGDNIINGLEYCDGDVDDEDCRKFGAAGGIVKCLPNCFLDISGCIIDNARQEGL